jgi:hypothetical protein
MKSMEILRNGEQFDTVRHETGTPENVSTLEIQKYLTNFFGFTHTIQRIVLLDNSTLSKNVHIHSE